MLVRENIDFVRGQDPRDVLKLGLETVIPNQFRELKKLDKKNWIHGWDVDTPYKAFYLYPEWTDSNEYSEEERDEIKKDIRSKITPLMIETGLSEYFIYDFHENLDEIAYKIKPEYVKIFKKLQDELNT